MRFVILLASAAVAACGQSSSSLPASLAGEWTADGFFCETDQPAERLAISVSGSSVKATKTTGDGCVPAGMVSWEGTYADNTINGDFHVALEGPGGPVTTQDAVFTVNADGTITGVGLTMKRAQ